MAAFARSLTPFYSDALPALVTAKDMTIENMFSTLTHFRLQRETLSKSLVNSAYTASGDNTKRSVTRFAGQKQKENKFNRMKKFNNKSTNPVTCSHCGMKWHEEKDCRIKKFQLRKLQ
ncbi:hypothetical protein V1507DRAFT_376327, partial [Lipomyces tetrasporus]